MEEEFRFRAAEIERQKADLEAFRHSILDAIRTEVAEAACGAKSLDQHLGEMLGNAGEHRQAMHMTLSQFQVEMAQLVQAKAELADLSCQLKQGFAQLTKRAITAARVAGYREATAPTGTRNATKPINGGWPSRRKSRCCAGAPRKWPAPSANRNNGPSKGNRPGATRFASFGKSWSGWPWEARGTGRLACRPMLRRLAVSATPRRPLPSIRPRQWSPRSRGSSSCNNAFSAAASDSPLADGSGLRDNRSQARCQARR